MPYGNTSYLQGNETLLNKECYGGRLSGGAAVLAGENTAEFLVTRADQSVLQTGTGMPCTCLYQGEGVGRAGGTISAGNGLQTNSSGLWVVATIKPIAVAMEDASSGQYFNLVMTSVAVPYPQT